METMLLRDKDIFPTNEVLENVLGKCYAAYKELTDVMTNEYYGLTLEWRFYNDGKSWLGKAVYKKKTVFWLSVWAGLFKINFYFTEKNRQGVFELNINEKIKASFAETEATGKLVSLSMSINNKQQIKDVLKIIKYKKTLK